MAVVERQGVLPIVSDGLSLAGALCELASASVGALRMRICGIGGIRTAGASAAGRLAGIDRVTRRRASRLDWTWIARFLGFFAPRRRQAGRASFRLVLSEGPERNGRAIQRAVR